jgi:hypothetical protein
MTEPSYVRKSLYLVFLEEVVSAFMLACLLLIFSAIQLCFILVLKEQPLKILCIIYLCTTNLLTEGPHLLL